ncbi:MAG: hypothetical protein QOE99_1365 [Actinomycetota bacterium]|nr:hypothetical protein [Actinomycetota bacterium]
MTDVKLLARWNGWCDPCEVERPLVLTEAGQRGLRAWLRGIGHEDRTLTLTCGVCGEWQDIPHDEADVEEPTTAPSISPVTLLLLGTRQVVVRTARVEAPVDLPLATVTQLPAPRAAIRNNNDVLELLSEGLDLITVAAR